MRGFCGSGMVGCSGVQVFGSSGGQAWMYLSRMARLRVALHRCDPVPSIGEGRRGCSCDCETATMGAMMSLSTGIQVLLAAAALAAVALPTSDGAARRDEPWDVPPLKEAFQGRFLIGTALNYPALQGRAPMDVA